MIHDEYKAALAANRKSSAHGVGISAQCFGLFDKIREVEEWLSVGPHPAFKEVHPELCFFALNGGAPASHSKKKTAGLDERRNLLAKAGFREIITRTSTATARNAVGIDDILDACAACWTAKRIFEGEADCVPPDGEGPKIWF